MKLRNKKTGRVWETPKERWPAVQQDDISFFATYGLEGHLFSYKTLTELNEEWEDYQPTEPLIKDEKILKAVRAWAEALGTDEVSYNSCAEYSEGRFEAEMGMADIDFGRVLDLKDGSYTITELCGEEEE